MRNSALKLFRVSPDRQPINQTIVQALAANIYTNIETMINWYRAALTWSSPFVQQAKDAWFGVEPPAIEIPTLLIFGTADEALGVAGTNSTERYVHDLTLILLEGVSHWTQLDAPELVSQTITEWLDAKGV